MEPGRIIGFIITFALLGWMFSCQMSNMRGDLKGKYAVKAKKKETPVKNTGISSLFKKDPDSKNQVSRGRIRQRGSSSSNQPFNFSNNKKDGTPVLDTGTDIRKIEHKEKWYEKNTGQLDQLIDRVRNSRPDSSGNPQIKEIEQLEEKQYDTLTRFHEYRIGNLIEAKKNLSSAIEKLKKGNVKDAINQYEKSLDFSEEILSEPDEGLLDYCMQKYTVLIKEKKDDPFVNYQLARFYYFNGLDYKAEELLFGWTDKIDPKNQLFNKFNLLLNQVKDSISYKEKQILAQLEQEVAVEETPVEKKENQLKKEVEVDDEIENFFKTKLGDDLSDYKE